MLLYEVQTELMSQNVPVVIFPPIFGTFGDGERGRGTGARGSECSIHCILKIFDEMFLIDFEFWKSIIKKESNGLFTFNCRLNFPVLQILCYYIKFSIRQDSHTVSKIIQPPPPNHFWHLWGRGWKGFWELAL